MASGAPERPVVLRRLGIIKDENDAEFPKPRPVQVNPAEDGLEAFGSETGSSGAFNTIADRAAAVLAYAGRNTWVPVVLISSLLLVAGVLLINVLSGPPEAPVAASTESTAPTSTDATAVSNVDVPSTAPAAATPAPAAPARAKTAAPRPAAPSPVRRAENPGNPGAASAPRVVAPPAVRGSDVRASVPPAVVAETSAPAAVPDALAAPVVDDRIYSAQDTDVIPPRTSEMLPGPTISSWTTRTNAMELIVSESGEVEHVKLVSAPQRMPDVLVLSRAKVWKFTPAMKDGRPVRYRLLLRWEVNP